MGSAQTEQRGAYFLQYTGKERRHSQLQNSMKKLWDSLPTRDLAEQRVQEIKARSPGALRQGQVHQVAAKVAFLPLEIMTTCAVSYLPMVVIHTMGLIGLVHNERSALKSAVAHHTSEALRMISIACGLQHPVCNSLFADTTLLQGALGKRKGDSRQDQPSPTVLLQEWQNRQTRQPLLKQPSATVGAAQTEAKLTTTRPPDHSFLPIWSPTLICHPRSHSQHSTPHRRVSHPHCRTVAPAAASHT